MISPRRGRSGDRRFDRGGITGSMPPICQVVANIVAVIALVAQEPVGIDVVQLHQRIIAFDIVRFAAGHAC